MKCIVASSVALALMFAGLQGSAQERQDRTQPGQQPGLQQPGQQPRAGLAQPGAHADIEAKLAGWLATCNQVQIEISQLAAQKASDPAVKQFAQKMVDEHTQLSSQLAQFLSPSDRERLRAGAAGGLDRTRTPGQPETRPQTDAFERQPDTQRRTETAAGRAGQDPFEQIAAEAAKKSTQMITGLLREKEGKEFDMCYSGLQVFAHINFVSELEAMEGHGSEQFQQVVTKAAQSTKSHLESAKQLAQKVGGSASSERVTRLPEQQGRQPERP
jgi:hypothetical protein